MGFIEDWQTAVINDPYWQFEEILEEDPELAELIWDGMRIGMLINKRFQMILSRLAEKNFETLPERKNELV